MHTIDSIQLVFWMLVPLEQGITVILMLRQRLIREVPWFFGYAVFHIVQFAVLFVCYRLSYNAYFYSYWALEGLDAILVLIVIQEIYHHAFRPFAALRELSAILFRWAVIVMLAVSVLAAASASGTEENRFIASLLILDRSASFVQLSLIFLLFIFKQAIGLPWRNLSHGVALGLGVIAASTSVTLTVRAYSNQSLDSVFGLALTLTYNVAVLSWIAILLRAERVPDRANLVSIGTLQKWDSLLTELINR